MKPAIAGRVILLCAVVTAGLPFAQETPPAQPPPAAAPAPVPTTVTVGEFAIKVATHLQLPTPAGGFTPEAAAWALVQKGVHLRPDLASPLVEGDVVTLLTALGYRIRTTTPSRVMTRDRLDAITTVFFSAPAP
jgi:hypothetical protein